ncbi:hypothetical protein ES703_57244 [subsurface metagenome]
MTSVLILKRSGTKAKWKEASGSQKPPKALASHMRIRRCADIRLNVINEQGGRKFSVRGKMK